MSQEPHSSSESSQSSVENTFRVLISTDNHLGYLEKDPIRGNDSFNTFEEILKTGLRHKVDMVLLGGDLFHDNRPSRETLHRTMELLRMYCMGKGDIGYSFHGDPKYHFKSKFPSLNYADPNYCVRLPVFSIHGNHDDPSGERGLAALDLLSVSNMVNYFGKSESSDNVTVRPLMFTKGTTKLAIYGLGNIRDERLHRTFESKKVTLERIENDADWFKIFVLHQNRVKHGSKNYIPSEMLDDFLDFVLWGHEHECMIQPETTAQGFFISQPGSSVATALSEGESKKKHIGLLKIRGLQFHLKAIPLETVRPFLLDEVKLSEVTDHDLTNPERLARYLETRVRSLIEKANASASQQAPNLPIIRLKVDYSGGFPTCNPQKFGQRFLGEVANPADLIAFSRSRAVPLSGAGTRDVVVGPPEPIDPSQIDDMILDILKTATQNNGLSVLPEKDFHEAVVSFVEKEDKDAISSYLAKAIENAQRHIIPLVDRSKTADEIVAIAKVAKSQMVLGASGISLHGTRQHLVKSQSIVSSDALVAQDDDDILVNIDGLVKLEENPPDENDDSVSPEEQGTSAQGRGLPPSFKATGKGFDIVDVTATVKAGKATASRAGKRKNDGDGANASEARPV
eukprot:TRINITY_DN5755_c0_g1_i10.p1 TRINITY_DN5755_c0_g1~~TRINITY_DN5755_c0_g1_i10.p1  ORF type:complete len:626 (+),score=125.13 TRINITY_DN5755_c0_g1_i10:80-1957(+)